VIEVDDLALGRLRHHKLIPPAGAAGPVETAGLDRLLLGSDFPSRGPLERVVRDIYVNLPAADRTAVLGGRR
jgi:hypothetical protein